MKIRYEGNRPVVSIMCSGRKNYVFYADNDFTQEVNDPVHIAQILRSVQHSFKTVAEEEVKLPDAPAPEVQETPIVEEPPILEEEPPIVEKKKDKKKFKKERK